MRRMLLLLLLSVGCSSQGGGQALGVHEPAANDQDAPETWLRWLNQPASHDAALRRLVVYCEEGVALRRRKADAPEVRAAFDKLVEPLTQQYVLGIPSEWDRRRLFRALAGTEDRRALPAVRKAIEEFVAGRVSAEEMTQAAQYAKAVRSSDLAGPLLAAFGQVHASDDRMEQTYRAVRKAMVATADPAWTKALLERVDRPIGALGADPKRSELDAVRDEVYWQMVSVEVLGELRSEEAIKPLYRTVVAPEKRNVSFAAVGALIKIGKPAVGPMLDILAGKDAEAAALGAKYGKLAPAMAAAQVLGGIGRAEARDPMISALNAADNDALRAVLARAIARLPSSPEGTRAVQKTYERVAIDALIPPGESAKTALVEASERLYDPQGAPWMLRQVAALRSVRGNELAAERLRQLLLRSSIKAAKKDQLAEVTKAVEEQGDAESREWLRASTEMLMTCGDEVGCYLARLDGLAVDQGDPLAAQKAAYMAGLLGTEATRAELGKRLPAIESGATRLEVLRAIEHLAPQGDAALADQLEASIEALTRPGKGGPVEVPVRQSLARLRGRAR